MNRTKVKSTEGIELPSDEKIPEKKMDINTSGYWSIIQQMKDKFKNEYFRRVKLILKSKLNGRNKIMALNTWVVSILRYGAGILKWNKNELQKKARKNR